MGTETDSFVDYSYFHDIDDHASSVGMNLRRGFETALTYHVFLFSVTRVVAVQFYCTRNKAMYC